MRTMKNEFHIEGYLYQHSLVKKVSGPKSANPGTEYIQGEIEIATDDAFTNIVKVRYPYVAAKTKSGADNSSFATFANIINGTFGSIMGNGPDKAVKLRVDTNLALNEFYSDRSGKMELVSLPQNQGGFIHVVPSLPEETNDETKTNPRNTFHCDILITNVKHIDENDETKTPEKAQVTGYIFGYRNTLIPFNFVAVRPDAMRYYEGLEASDTNPVFTSIKGSQISTTVVREIVEESAFGGPHVRTATSSRSEYQITWGLIEPYDFDDESTITRDELTQAKAEREVYLASLKTSREEANAAKASESVAPAASNSSNFNF